ncbi:MAG: hypothetical protein GF317_00155 [Candidatus Lokiarchaeota archaeon]|nr:hypothetical protein [Candidatus Lokiarchaeota archaeon]MBD3198395.1 hypothetical protein [Candidatus Lokiarchaeota archaeon]
MSNEFELRTSSLGVDFMQEENRLREEIFIDQNNQKIPILTNSQKKGVLCFLKGKKKDFIPFELKSHNADNVIFQSAEKEIQASLSVGFTDSDTLRYQYELYAKNWVKISSFRALYEIPFKGYPEFLWIPHLKPKNDYVIPDHVFRSPCIIYKKGNIAFAIIPDLDLLQKNYLFKSFLDINFNNNPNLSYGFGRYDPKKHVFFKHSSRKKIHLEPYCDFSFGYYVKVFQNHSIPEILNAVNNFFWNTYGKQLLYDNLDPQILPYERNVEEGMKAIFERHKYWGDFSLNGKKCGGIWIRSWMGDQKQKLTYISPDELEDHKKARKKEIAGTKSFLGKIINKLSSSPRWIGFFDKYTRHHPIVRRTAEVWNNAWFLNIRTGYGIRFFGELWNKEELKEKGEKIFSTLLSLPRSQGLFPSVILPAGKDTDQFSFINGVKAFRYIDGYHIVDSCLAMYWALKFYQDFQKDELVIKHADKLKNLIKNIQLNNGTIPTYVDINEEDVIIPKKELVNSASSGAALMFIMELYKITKDKSIIHIANKIADYIEKEILPENKWHDFEPFFSCTSLPLDFYDDNTHTHVMNNLSIYWCAEGFKELYKVSKDAHILEVGEHILGILSLFQQVWNIPNLSYHTFGGFGVQNADAELSDARQALFVRIYMEYYLETGKEEYMERGIAALRASWALQLLSEYQKICPGNLKGIETVDGIDRGCVCENYGHNGTDMRVPGYIMFDWGLGTATMATAYTKKHFGDIFIDFKFNKVWGLDGILIQNVEFTREKVIIRAKILSAPREIILKTRKPPKEGKFIEFNDLLLGKKESYELEKGFSITIETD